MEYTQLEVSVSVSVIVIVSVSICVKRGNTQWYIIEYRAKYDTDTDSYSQRCQIAPMAILEARSTYIA